MVANRNPTKYGKESQCKKNISGIIYGSLNPYFFLPGREILILLHDPNIFPAASVNHCHYQYGQKFTISASQTLNTVLAELIDIN